MNVLFLWEIFINYQPPLVQCKNYLGSFHVVVKGDALFQPMNSFCSFNSVTPDSEKRYDILIIQSDEYPKILISHLISGRSSGIILLLFLRDEGT